MAFSPVLNMSIKVTKTAFERAEPVGRELVRQCQEERQKRKRWADNECAQSAKEIATGLCAMARGKMTFGPLEISQERFNSIFRKKVKQRGKYVDKHHN